MITLPNKRTRRKNNAIPLNYELMHPGPRGDRERGHNQVIILSDRIGSHTALTTVKYTKYLGIKDSSKGRVSPLGSGSGCLDN